MPGAMAREARNESRAHRHRLGQVERRQHTRPQTASEKQGDRHKEIAALNDLLRRHQIELDKAAARAEADDQEIRLLRQQLNDAGAHVQTLRQQLDDAGKRAQNMNKRHSDDETQVRHLQQLLDEAKTHATFQDSLLEAGIKAVQEQRVRAETAEQEVSRLEEDLEDSKVNLEDQLVHYEAAMTTFADDFTRSALEAQARRSVYMIQGYQDDIARQKATIEKLRTALAERDRTIREHEAAPPEQSRELQETKRLLIICEQRVKDERGIANEQAELIRRLNAENSELLARS